MGIKYNPLTFSGLDFTGSGAAGGAPNYKGPVANEAALPVVGNSNGDVRVTLDSSTIWIWDGGSWQQQASVDAAQTLTNKTIDADSNTISNIENADIKAAAAIDASKLADGSVSNTKFQYVNTLSSNAQDQLDGKASLALDNLASTAANASINPDADSVYGLGGSGLAWANVHTGRVNDTTDTYSINMDTATLLRSSGTRLTWGGASGLTIGANLFYDRVGAGSGVIKSIDTTSSRPMIYSTGTASTGGSGSVTLSTGAGVTGTGDVSVFSGTPSVTNVGSGAVSATSGDATGTGTSGSTTISTGATVNGNSGDIVIASGVPSGAGVRGQVSFNGSQINANSTKIINLTNPTLAQDAATKNYVDTFPGVFFNFGSGVHGAFALNGSNNFTQMTRVGSIYYLLQPIYASSITISSGVTLVPGPYTIYCSGTLTNAGTISNNGTTGGNASGFTGGAPGFAFGEWEAAAVVPRGTAQFGALGINPGADGTATIGNDSSGSASSNNFIALLGGNGGAGGNGTGGNGGAGSTSLSSSAAGTAIECYFLTPSLNTVGGAILLAAGSPGSTGGGGGGSVIAEGGGGGSGGSGGQIIAIYTNSLNNTGTIRANGGAGGNGAAGTATNCGGGGAGGGGSGGLIYLFYSNDIALGTIQVAGGAAGTRGATGGGSGVQGGTGTSGSSGVILKFKVLTGVWS